MTVFISCLEETLLHHLGDDGFAMKLGSFGKFSIRHRPATRRKIPFTGVVRDVPLKRKVKFISLGKLRRLESDGHGTSSQADRGLSR